MPTKIIVPTAMNLRRTLEMLFGDGLHVAEALPHESAEQARYFAIYNDDAATPIAACGCDTRFTAFSGACLSRIPAHIAEQAVENNDLTPIMLNNFYEIMNICSNLLMDNHTPHLCLDKVQPKTLLNGALDDMKAFSGFYVEIPNYGKGTVTFFSTME